MSGNLAGRIRAGALANLRKELGRSGVTVREIREQFDSRLSGHRADERYGHPRYGVCHVNFVAAGGDHECERPANHPGSGHRCRCGVKNSGGEGSCYAAWKKSTG